MQSLSRVCGSLREEVNVGQYLLVSGLFHLAAREPCGCLCAAVDVLGTNGDAQGLGEF